MDKQSTNIANKILNFFNELEKEGYNNKMIYTNAFFIGYEGMKKSGASDLLINMAFKQAKNKIAK